MNSPISHRVAELCYSLTDQPISLEPLRILEERTITWNDWQVTFYVLGTSHAVRLQRGNVCLTEILSCLPPPEDVPMLLRAETPAEAEDAILHTCTNGFLCVVVLKSFALLDGDHLRYPTRKNRHLDLVYPTLDGLPAAVTRIGWGIFSDHLIIETIHSYPDEGRGIRSVTSLCREVTD